MAITPIPVHLRRIACSPPFLPKEQDRRVPSIGNFKSTSERVAHVIDPYGCTSRVHFRFFYLGQHPIDSPQEFRQCRSFHNAGPRGSLEHAHQNAGLQSMPGNIRYISQCRTVIFLHQVHQVAAHLITRYRNSVNLPEVRFELDPRHKRVLNSMGERQLGL